MQCDRRKRYWGKLKTEGEGPDRRVVAWHPLVDHCADVAATAEALLTRTILGRRLARLGGVDRLSPAQVARLTVLAGLHDVGKVNHGFQNKALARPEFTEGHVGAVLSLLRAEGALSAQAITALGLQTEWLGEAVEVLVASVAHHGRIVLESEGGFDGVYWRPAGGRAPLDAMAGLLGTFRRWFPEAWDEAAPALPQRPEFAHAFSGLVTFADWLGSDTQFFPFSEEGAPARLGFAREQAARALREIGLDPGPARAALGQARPGFSSVSAFPAPRPAQAVIEGLALEGEGSTTVLEAETGSGKTEAALIRYLQLFHAGEVDGLYFALPTRAAALQIYERVVKAVARAFGEHADRPPVILAVPGYLSADGVEGKRLPGYEVLWPDDELRGLRQRGWAAEGPKRYLGGAVVVGTVDQALLSTLKVKHSHLRAAGLLRHLLCVDEVHASDAYMQVLVEQVVRRQRAAGGHVFLMSATLGAEARARFLGGGGRCPSLSEALEAPYPLVSAQGGGGAPVALEVAGDGRRKAIAVTLAPEMEQAEAVAARALSAALEGARVLVIRSTVRACLETQVALEAQARARGREELCFSVEGQLTPHHSRYDRADRLRLDRAIEATLGPDRVASAGGKVIVATQTVEASLDIDADLLITDLCPMDVLLQRLGRLHRHPRDDRPLAYCAPQAVVLVPSERALGRFIREKGEARGPGGVGTVYRDLRILEATWRDLEEAPELVIPAQNRARVERCTHPAALEAQVARLEEDPGLGPLWAQHARALFGTQAAQKTLAGLGLQDWGIPVLDPDSAAPGGEQAEKIKTRLGADDRVFEFPQRPLGPFGERVRALSLAAHQLRGVPTDVLPTELTQAPWGFEFSLGARRFRYDRFGLRAAEVGDSNTGESP